MARIPHIKPDFDKEADAVVAMNFADYLQYKFGAATARNVFKAFEQMGLPAPDKKEEFLKGTEGALIFINELGVVVRIENEVSEFAQYERIDDSPQILKPLGSISAGEAIIEICPGCRNDVNSNDRTDLRRSLKRQGFNFWDSALRNIGRLPVKTAEFPNGIPVVIDRLAVDRLTRGAKRAKSFLSKIKSEKADKILAAAVGAEEALYGPLRDSFNENWPDTQKMKTFWGLCRSYVAEGKLVAGWNHNESRSSYDDKIRGAKSSAGNYAERLRLTSSGGPAVHQSPRPPA